MRYLFRHGESDHSLELVPAGEGFHALLDGRRVEVSVLRMEGGELRLSIDGRAVTVYYAGEGRDRWLWHRGETYRLSLPAGAARASKGGETTERAVRAPMPASVRMVSVHEGALVEAGQTLLVLEAMKMEIRVAAPRAGVVEKVLVAAGQTVEKEQTLLELAPAPGETGD